MEGVGKERAREERRGMQMEREVRNSVARTTQMEAEGNENGIYVR